ncbi:DEAD/DEAH box helicase [Shimia aestuarii]|uniref:Helicase conserved C-terminal domain-containing protein n=1 Tax=Shimia aestuarii TaxID=254406 RepID=A0A1I4TJ26_9RHOB|nr:DEAD/DEAH box helicase [Shimia aestuarii]SFM76577.1 Helicase conserved C-terminal domain-containing protein [Shimia aestuarii]
MFDLFSAPLATFTPRPHQQRALELLKASLEKGHKRPVLQLPTGGGKTFVAAQIIKGALKKGRRVVFTVPYLSLLQQTIEAFESFGIGDLGVIQSDHSRTDPEAPVQIASVDTLARRGFPDVDLVIVDEAHKRSSAIDHWMKVRPDLVFVGLSATPWRKGMAEEWDDLVIGSDLAELVKEGVLTKFRVFAEAEPDLSGVKTVSGDYETGVLGQVMSAPRLVADIVHTWLSNAEYRPTVCFAVNRAHAQELQRQFTSEGIACGYVDANTPPDARQRVREKFERGELKVVCNVGCLTTGVDWDVRCIILARPTKSEMLYVQMVGRGLRAADGKQDCLILDHSDTTARLGFVRDIGHAELLSSKAKTAKRARKEDLPKMCPACKFLKPSRASKCPGCGFVSRRQNKIKPEEGELVEIAQPIRSVVENVGAKREEKQSFLSGLISVQEQRNYDPGWVKHVFRDKFNHWPENFSWAACEPSEEVKRYVKSRDIRNAKKREKAGR